MRWWHLPRESPQFANADLETIRHVVNGRLGYAVRTGLPAPTGERERHAGHDVTRLGEAQAEEVDLLRPRAANRRVQRVGRVLDALKQTQYACLSKAFALARLP